MHLHRWHQIVRCSFMALLRNLCVGLTGSAETKGPHVTVTILATNVGDIHAQGKSRSTTQGEWSFAAWIEADGRAFLFDTGWSPRNVLLNAEVLGIHLSRAEDLILSHHHEDHTGGVETLRKELIQKNPKALSRIHVAEGNFASRPGPNETERNPMVARRMALEAFGSSFLVYSQTTEIAPNVCVTGPVPRHHPEENYPQNAESVMQRNGETVHEKASRS